MTPLNDLSALGQAVWLDFVSRDFIADGGLARLVAEDSVTGVTSNPAIFEKAIKTAASYDSAIRAALAEGDTSVSALFEGLAVRDIQAAADVLRPVYDATRGADGYVSLEVSPYLADDAAATVAEAERLWAAVHRRNLMIKVPVTQAGVSAIRTLIGRGLNVNVTLLFSQDVYEQVALAYLDGLEAFQSKGGDLARVASVASFFISRIDTIVDGLIEQKLRAGADSQLASLKGKTAIANAKLAYRRFERIFSGPRWDALARGGARVQRLLWASTGTKNPGYSDVLYVDGLIGPHTVNTMPPATLDAFRDHGAAALTLSEGVDEAHHSLEAIVRAGIDVEIVARDLLGAGVQLFADAADSLLGALARKRAQMLTPRLNGASSQLAEPLASAVADAHETWRVQGNIRRLWAKDAALWTGGPEARWLGWLDGLEREAAHVAHYEALAEDVRGAGFRHVLLIGMGGSSLGPEVVALTLGSKPGYPHVTIIDSTDPDQIRETAAEIDPANTLFLVASKSGSTLEPNVLKDYFWDLTRRAVGADRVGRHFIAVTDPGSSLEALAKAQGFRHVVYGEPTIGGRFSVLSPFGLVPAALGGVDLKRFIARTLHMVRACGPDVPPAENPGVALGLVLGAAVAQGRDKLTVFASPGLDSFGTWVEQLVAESTGKRGKAIIPLEGEAIAGPQTYGNDRLFVHVKRAGDSQLDAPLGRLADAGHAVITLMLEDVEALGQEFFRWEIATAVAGAMMGIDPFDQPDVEASKVKTRALTDAVERDGALPDETPIFSGDGVELYTDTDNATALRALGAGSDLASWLRAHFGRTRPGDYVALLAYVPRNQASGVALQDMRHLLRDRYKVATCVGFGPRFLHSTGQAYKGGPNNGIILQITAREEDLPVPGRSYGFATVEAAQARGDFDVLVERGRRALRVHLTQGASEGLTALGTALSRAMA